MDFWGFRTDDETAWDAAPYFFVGVANLKNAAVQPGKWTILKIRVATNNGNRFTAIEERLGPIAGTYQKTSVGGVTFDPNVHGTYFAAGARVVLCNQNGTPLLNSPMHGAAALRRAYGQWMKSTR